MKRINKRIFCTLTLISSTFLPYLTINVKAKTDILGAKTWTEDSGNISNGYLGFMFEDSRHNLWSAGNSTPLQRYDYIENKWKTSLEIAGNLSNGIGGFMFEDSRRNLWSAGYGTALQKYDYGTSTWETNAAISGNLSNGDGGFMFEDSRRNLWSAGTNMPLQRYNYGTSRWETGNAISGNLGNGWGGFMFQDNRGNLWSAGRGAALQRYNYGTSRWETGNAISGNLSDGLYGFMFQDNRGNLWSAGRGAALQRYNYGTSRWETGNAISGNLSDGRNGFMFQDSRNNLWSVGYGTALQKYDYSTSRWETGNAISGNLSDGLYGFMFQDNRGNLWSAGRGAALQRYNYGTSRWETGNAISGNLSDGLGGFMFEDSRRNLWSAGFKIKLQVMHSNKDVASVIALIKANTGMTKDATGEILPIFTGSNTPFDATALNSLGTGGTFPTNIRDTTLTYSHEGISTDGNLEVTVTIVKNGESAAANFNIAVSGIDLAKTEVQKEANKFGDFSSTDSLNSTVAILPLNVEDVKTQFEAITSYNAPSLTGGYSISKVTITDLDPKTRKIFYTISVSDTNSNIATKDIVVTFAVSAISKDKDLSKGAIAGITIGSILGVGILGFLIYHLFKKIKK